MRLNVRAYRPIKDCLDWQKLCRESLIREKFAVFSAQTSKAVVSDRFLFLAEDEIRAIFDEAQEELEIATYLSIVAACESRLRVDARTRAKDPNDKLGESLKRLLDDAGQEWQVPFEKEGLLDAWKENIQRDIADEQLVNKYVSAIGEFKPCIRVRHWIAHGRYWDADGLSAIGQLDALEKRTTRLFDRLAEYTGKSGKRGIA